MARFNALFRRNLFVRWLLSAALMFATWIVGSVLLDNWKSDTLWRGLIDSLIAMGFFCLFVSATAKKP